MEIFDDAQDRAAGEKFLDWRIRWPEGFVINYKSPNNVMLHRAKCGHFTFKESDEVNLAASKKICSLDREEVESWATREGIAHVKLCQHCKL